MRKRTTLIYLLILLAIAAGCQPTPTATAVPATMPPPTWTPIPPTPIPPTPTPALPAFMAKPPDHVRVLNYNVNWDSIFEDGNPHNHPYRLYDMSDAFVRILQALQPDIVCLQEINSSRDAQDVADILDQALPLDGAGWQAHRGQDNMIAARYPLTLRADGRIHEERALSRGHALALVDLPDGQYPDLYLVSAHFKSAGGSVDILMREHHGDILMTWVRDLKTPGGKIDLPANTPFMIMGDLNVYETDDHKHLNTLITGDITHEAKYGPDVDPDWDGTALTDALPTHNGQGELTWTWRNDGEGFAPGALDRMIYSDSVIQVGNAFVLNTTLLSEAELAAAGLQRNDVVLDPSSGYYDHLPMVLDIAFTP